MEWKRNCIIKFKIVLGSIGVVNLIILVDFMLILVTTEQSLFNQIKEFI